MSRNAPRGHTADSRELLTAVTARAPLRLVHDATAAKAQPGDRCTWCNPAACQWPQCTTAGDCGPTVPTRRVRRLPTLPWWRRLALRWFPSWRLL